MRYGSEVSQLLRIFSHTLIFYIATLSHKNTFSSVHTVRLSSEIFVSDTNLTVCTAIIHVL